MNEPAQNVGTPAQVPTAIPETGSQLPTRDLLRPTACALAVRAACAEIGELWRCARQWDAWRAARS